MSFFGSNSRILLRICRQLQKRSNNHQIRRNFSSKTAVSVKFITKGIGLATAVGVGYTFWTNCDFLKKVEAKKQKEKDEDFATGLKLTSRERHFIKFASVEYDGQIYMTPQDFLESFVEEEPRPRLKRRQITKKEIDEIKHSTPAMKKGSSQLFRSLRDKGIISYTEYLFLLSILTKPETGFLIAFNMFDTDGNHRVDKEEFLVILHLLSGQANDRAAISAEMKKALTKLSINVEQSAKKAAVAEISETKSLSFMEKIFSHAWSDKHGGNENTPSNVESSAQYAVSDGEGLKRKTPVDTTLLIHFFGKKGNTTLKYEEFRKFMENLQTEVLEMEFQEFAKGAPTISEIDFAKILLRYTHLDSKICNMYLDRLLNRLKEEKEIPPGISFPEFKIFCQFLNNLEDFTIAMRMYTLADHPISKGEFHRAVKICTGAQLSQHLVHTVFNIFDEDGDGQLSYREFIAIMKDRLHRGFKSHIKGEGWEGFKTCIKQEFKSPVAR